MLPALGRRRGDGRSQHTSSIGRFHQGIEHPDVGGSVQAAGQPRVLGGELGRQRRAVCPVGTAASRLRCRISTAADPPMTAISAPGPGVDRGGVRRPRGRVPPARAPPAPGRTAPAAAGPRPAGRGGRRLRRSAGRRGCRRAGPGCGGGRSSVPRATRVPARRQPERPPQPRLLAGGRELGHLGLDQLHGHPDQFDDLRQRHRPAATTPSGSSPAGGAEDLAGDLGRRFRPAQPVHETRPPAWATRPTADRSSAGMAAGMAANQGSTSPIRATAWVASLPLARSIRRSDAGTRRRAVTQASLPHPSRVRRAVAGIQSP